MLISIFHLFDKLAVNLYFPSKHLSDACWSGEGESCRSLFSNKEGIAGRSVGLRHQHKIKDATTSLEPNSPKRFFYTNFVQTVALMSSITSSDVDGRGWALSCKLQDGVTTELSSVRCQLFFFKSYANAYVRTKYFCVFLD